VPIEEPVAFWEVQEAIKIDHLDVEVHAYPMTRLKIKARALIAPVYKELQSH